jgi:CRISPR/Cas system CMR subunit Cmr6 (Cas7 group RAMP superfamily)
MALSNVVVVQQEIWEERRAKSDLWDRWHTPVPIPFLLVDNNINFCAIPAKLRTLV